MALTGKGSSVGQGMPEWAGLEFTDNIRGGR